MTPFTSGSLPDSRDAGDPLRFLLVEDNPGDARLLEEHLGEVPGLEHGLTRVRTRTDALGALVGTSPPFDLVFLDLDLPDSQGTETVKRVVEAASGIPIVVLTGHDGVHVAAEALTRGVQDYLVKDKLGPEDLARAILTALERQRVQRELEEERAQLQQIIDEAPAFMALYHGPDHVLERANEAWYELVGDRRAVGEPVRKIFPEFRGEGPVERLDRVYRTGEPVQVRPERIELRTGGEGQLETRFVRIAYVPRVKEAEVVGVIVHGVDITETVRAHREVRSRQEVLESILETAAEGIVFTDVGGSIQFANPAAERIMGLEEAEITDRAYDDAAWEVVDLDGRSLSPEELPVTRAIRDGESVRDAEFAIRTGDGGQVILSVNAAPLHGEGEELKGAVASFRDVTDRKQFERQLRRRALHDHLTELPNRALFRDRLEQALRRSRRTGQGFALAYLDLKRFKVVNDSLGHAAGDRVLQEVARRLQAAVREADTVARIGGDEFTVLLEDMAGREAVSSSTERLVEALRDAVDLGGSAVPVEASIGVALCLDGETAEAASASVLLRRADAAMYEAKDRPGTMYVLADPDEKEAASGRMERERELREALAEGRIDTVYQPLFGADRSGPLGVEALARWRHPERGVISPGEFIPLAEETGLIIELGEQQLAAACGTLLELTGERPARDLLQLHVNVSARQLLDPDVVDRVEGVLGRCGFPARRLTLEITETAAMREPAALEGLRRLGVSIAIDDFGTQYSSLAQVKRLEVDALKIDRSFVSGLPDATADVAIVRTVITLSEALELEVVAEGVETEAQLEVLRKAGCGLVQGFLLAEPLGADELRSLLRSSAS